MRYTAMKKDNVLALEGRETIATDALTQLLKSGAQQMLQVAHSGEVDHLYRPKVITAQS